jgi:hypothetical protein
MDGKKLERYVNLAFPRTFSCQRRPEYGDALPPVRELRAERTMIAWLLEAEGVVPEEAYVLAIDEMGERRCIDAAFLGEYLDPGGKSIEDR